MTRWTLAVAFHISSVHKHTTMMNDMSLHPYPKGAPTGCQISIISGTLDPTRDQGAWWWTFWCIGVVPKSLTWVCPVLSTIMPIGNQLMSPTGWPPVVLIAHAGLAVATHQVSLAALLLVSFLAFLCRRACFTHRNERLRWTPSFGRILVALTSTNHRASVSG